MKRECYLVREGRVEYYDLCRHTDVSREEFFKDSGLKRMVDYGLILEMDDVVKVLNCDDMDDNSECEGIVIPKGCVIEITFWGDSADITPVDSEVN